MEECVHQRIAKILENMGAQETSPSKNSNGQTVIEDESDDNDDSNDDWWDGWGAENGSPPQ